MGIQYSEPKLQKNPQALSNQVLFFFNVVIGLWIYFTCIQICIYIYDENKKEIYTNKYSSAVVLVLD